MQYQLKAGNTRADRKSGGILASDNAEYITGTANVIDGGNMIPETSVMGVHSTE